MSKGINLLGSKKQIVLSPLARKLKVVRLLSVWLLFSISAASVILFLLIALSPLPGLKEQEQKALATISQQHPDIAKLLLVSDRLKSSATLISKRNNFGEVLGLVRSNIPDGVSITALSMKEKTVSVTVTSPSLGRLDTFLANLISATEEKKEFSQVELISLSTDSSQSKSLFTVIVNLVIL